MTGNEMFSTHTDPLDLTPELMSPLQPHVIVLFGGAGDLARRKLLPGLMHLRQAGLLPECRIVGTSLEAFDDDGFRAFAREHAASSAPTASPTRSGRRSGGGSPTSSRMAVLMGSPPPLPPPELSLAESHDGSTTSAFPPTPPEP